MIMIYNINPICLLNHSRIIRVEYIFIICKLVIWSVNTSRLTRASLSCIQPWTCSWTIFSNNLQLMEINSQHLINIFKIHTIIARLSITK